MTFGYSMDAAAPTRTQGRYAYAALRVPTPAEFENLFRRNPARAQRDFAQLDAEARRARNTDIRALKREAHDKTHQRQLEDAYRRACLIPQNRAVDKLRLLHARLIESASASELDRLEPEFRRSSPWDMAMAIGSAAAVVTAPRRPSPLPRRTPAARPAARRPRRRATGARSGDPPGSDSDDPEPGSPGSWFSFDTFYRLTPGVSGAERLARFSKLSPEAQDRTWQNLARELEGSRR